MTYYFVIYFYNYKDKEMTYETSFPQDRGCNVFATKELASSFIKVWKNKGYVCHLFLGEHTL